MSFFNHFSEICVEPKGHGFWVVNKYYI